MNEVNNHLKNNNWTLNEIITNFAKKYHVPFIGAIQSLLNRNDSARELYKLFSYISDLQKGNYVNEFDSHMSKFNVKILAQKDDIRELKIKLSSANDENNSLKSKITSSNNENDNLKAKII